MKKHYFILLLGLFVSIANAQWNNTFPYPNTGEVGIGTGTSQSNVHFNFQVHGITDYIVSSSSSHLPSARAAQTKSIRGASLNYGKTARIGITNSVTGGNSTDGTVLRMSKYDFSITNQEKKNMSFRTGNVGLTMNGSHKRIWMGSDGFYLPNTSPEQAAVNVVSTFDNGLFIRSNSSQGSKFGLSVRMKNNKHNSIQVVSTNGNDVNFAVRPNGEVYARKYTTTLNPFPDYVFENDYNLMPLDELRTFVTTNKHLPNIPTAKTVEKEGADLGEMNRLLVEKVEELTLYVLQLEERLKKVETQK